MKTKSKMQRNQLALKGGSYSLIVTAAVLAIACAATFALTRYEEKQEEIKNTDADSKSASVSYFSSSIYSRISSTLHCRSLHKVFSVCVEMFSPRFMA